MIVLFRLKPMLFQWVTLLISPPCLFASTSLAPVESPDLSHSSPFQDPSGTSEVISQSPSETLRLTPEMLLSIHPEQKPVNYIIIQDREIGPMQKIFRGIILMGWVREAMDWIYTSPRGKISDKEKKIRDEWETRLGKDYFYLYDKYQEAEEIIDHKTTFDFHGFETKAKFKLRSKDIEVTFKKTF